MIKAEREITRQTFCGKHSNQLKQLRNGRRRIASLQIQNPRRSPRNPAPTAGAGRREVMRVAILSCLAIFSGCNSEPPKQEYVDRYVDCIGGREYVIVNSKAWPYTNMAVPVYDESDRIKRCDNKAGEK